MQSFLIKNQNGLFLDRNGEWVDCTQSSLIYHTKLRDEALNRMVEVNSQDFQLRLRIAVATVDAKGRLQIPEEEQYFLLRSESDGDGADETAVESDAEITVEAGAEPESNDPACTDAAENSEAA